MARLPDRPRKVNFIQPLQRQISNLFEDFFGTWPTETLEGDGQWLPSIDMSETENDVILKAEVPGVNPEDIDITLRDDVLTMQGEKADEREFEEQGVIHRERTTGRFIRKIRLPAPVNAERVEADSSNGILTIKMPKQEEAKSKPIKVKTTE